MDMLLFVPRWRFSVDVERCGARRGRVLEAGRKEGEKKKGEGKVDEDG